MANTKQSGGDVGYKKAYKMTGTPGYAGGPSETNLDAGPAGSHRNNNWKIGAAQAKMANSDKIGPDKNLKEIKSGNFY